MKMHPILGVLALAVVMAVAGAFMLNAGDTESAVSATSDGCAQATAACGPCPSAGNALTKATTAEVSPDAIPTTAVAAGCDPSRCQPMTPEQCAAQGCDPSQCATKGCDPSQCATKCANAQKANATLIDAKSEKASDCTGPCKPSPGCGSHPSGSSGTDKGI